MTNAPKRREIGIVFTDTVPALLLRQKHQTRRLMKVDVEEPVEAWRTDDRGTWYGVARLATTGGLGVPVTEMIRCPFGVVGDRFYAKEAWQAWRQTSIEYDEWEPETDPDRLRHSHLEYRAGGASVGPWRSPMFMPKWAARLWYELTDIRPQRVQEITDDDARAEGVRELPLQEGQPGAWWTIDVSAGARFHGRTPVLAYAKAWDAIHGKGAWERNDHVWALTFKPIEVSNG